ncbi:uncharacterized protein LOC134470216 [Engraulis encrasicolus]|uniref:uncharacterized protein LOC134470216 n=1 Tax=Engraulis encrasicolus TaxID=184585 RepID=UPI002FCF6C39
MAIKTLNELDQLRDSYFGRPKPRHGLRLLFWFIHDFIKFHLNQMVAKGDPYSGIFGFHRFYNRPDDGTPLLPPPRFQYYEVGNLKELNASQFPDYVREEYTGRLDNSNSDRIIVDMSGRNVNRLYVTHHSDLSNFSRSGTYCISQGLVNIIKRMDLEEFLSEMGQPRRSSALKSNSRGPPKQPSGLQTGTGSRPTANQSAVSQPDNRKHSKDSVVLELGVTDSQKQTDDCCCCKCMGFIFGVALIIGAVALTIKFLSW